MHYRTLAVATLLTACGGPSQAATESTSAPASQGEALAAPEATPTFGSLDAAIAGPHRSEENRARDRYRHPRETLEFFGIQPGMTVVELSPGAGWYSEILAPYLAPEGRLVAGVPAASGPGARYRQRFVDRTERAPELFANVTLGTLAAPDNIELGAPGSADAVLTFRNTHNWAMRQQEGAVYQAAFRVLKPGGVFGVVQHRARPETDPAETAPSGYVSEAHVIATAEAAGFVLEDRSDINANPNDTTDHPEGVWTLPPILRLGDQDRERYLAIGESDRMTLRFRKPSETASASDDGVTE